MRGSGERVHDPVPDPGASPAQKAVVARHGAPDRSTQKMPFKTRRSSTRGTPRGLFGNKGWITDHSKSVRSNRAISTSSVEQVESAFGLLGNPVYGSVT